MRLLGGKETEAREKGKKTVGEAANFRGFSP